MEGVRRSEDEEVEFGKRGLSSTSQEDDVTVDWRGRPSNPHTHGGMRAALFVLGISLSPYFFLLFFFATSAYLSMTLFLSHSSLYLFIIDSFKFLYIILIFYGFIHV